MAFQKTALQAKSDEVRPYQKMVGELQNLHQLDTEQGGSFEIASQVIDKIAVAESLDDVFAANESALASLKMTPDLWGRTLTVVDVLWRKADAKYEENSLGAYAIVTAFDTKGDEIKFSVGAPNVVASLRQAQKLGYANYDKPFECRFINQTTSNGYDIFKVARP